METIAAEKHAQQYVRVELKSCNSFYLLPSYQWRFNTAVVMRVRCRCEKRAQDLQLPHLFVFARLALAQFALEHQTGSAQQPGNHSTAQLRANHQGKGRVCHMYACG